MAGASECGPKATKASTKKMVERSKRCIKGKKECGLKTKRTLVSGN